MGWYGSRSFPGVHAVESGGANRVRFPDGRNAWGKEEKIQAGKQWSEKKIADQNKAHAEHMNLMHPQGLCMIKNPDGAIVRPAGSKPWLK